MAELMGRVAAHNILVAESGKGKRKHYHESPNILCVMDTGNGAAFVFRNAKNLIYYTYAIFWPLDEKKLGNLCQGK